MADPRPNKPVRVPFFNKSVEFQDPDDFDFGDTLALPDEDYQQCKPIWPNLPDTAQDFIDWLSFADVENLAGLIAETYRRLSRSATPNPMLSLFLQVMLEQITFRSDTDLIRRRAGLTEDPVLPIPANRDDRKTKPSRKSRRRAIPAHLQKPSRPGFREHVRLELNLAGQRKERGSAFPYNQKSDKPAFAESFGPLELFPIREAEEIYKSAEVMNNGDNQKYIERRIIEVLKHGNRRNMAMAPTVEQIEDLRRRFPNAGEVIDIIERAAALSRLSPTGHFEMPPILLDGDPGVGKTAVVKAIAKSITAPFQRVDIATLSTGSQLFGVSLTWSTGRTGLIFNMLTSSPVMNLVLQLDEIDKARGNEQSPVIPPLLSLLERETSKSFQDEAIPLTMDASRILWFATANDLLLLPGPLRSRFNIVQIYRPEGEHAVTIAGQIYASIREANPWGARFPEHLDRKVALRLANWTPREMYRLLNQAFGAAALMGRMHLLKSDIPLPETQQERRFGFL